MQKVLHTNRCRLENYIDVIKIKGSLIWYELLQILRHFILSKREKR